jgi:DNA-binding NarL/FixJ family response regulator
MRRSRVVVLYTHPLFGQGIGQLLRADDQLDVTCLAATCEGTRDELVRLHPEAIVLEASPDEGLWDSLRDLPPSTVVRVGLDENTMDIYQRHQILSAGPENLVQAIRASLRRRAT